MKKRQTSLQSFFTSSVTSKANKNFNAAESSNSHVATCSQCSASSFQADSNVNINYIENNLAVNDTISTNTVSRAGPWVGRAGPLSRALTSRGAKKAVTDRPYVNT
jgi:hypothetical protein